MLHERHVTCPYCGERFATTIDASGGSQQYIEDCYVCCRPIVFIVETDHQGELSDVILQREDQ